MGFFNRDKNKDKKGEASHAETTEFFNMKSKEAGKSKVTQAEAQQLLAAMKDRPAPRPDDTVTFKDFKKNHWH